MSATIQAEYTGIAVDRWIANWFTGAIRKDRRGIQTLARRVAADLAPGAKILEVGSRCGFLAVELARPGTFEVSGLDSSAAFVEIARHYAAREKTAVDFRRGNADSMRFADERFDRIVCRAASREFGQPAKALKEIHRVLKPGGRALIVETRKDTPLFKRAYTKRQFQELAAESGFSEISIAETDSGFEAWLEK